jgi:hypothetical protein
MSGTGGRRPLRYRGVQLRSENRRPLLAAVLSSALAIYLGAGGVLVAIRSHRDFSAGAWVIVGCIVIASAWVAVRSWRKVAANRREST